MTIEVLVKAHVELPDNPFRSLDGLNDEVENLVAKKFEHFVVVSHKEADELLSA